MIYQSSTAVLLSCICAVAAPGSIQQILGTMKNKLNFSQTFANRPKFQDFKCIFLERKKKRILQQEVQVHFNRILIKQLNIRIITWAILSLISIVKKQTSR